MIILILWCMLDGLPVLLIFEYFCENSLRALRLVYSVCGSDSLNIHSSSMHCIELVFNLYSGSWWSLTSSCIWINLILCNRRSSNIQFCRLSRYQILSLIAAWLNYKSLISIWHCITSTNRASINRLPCVLCSLYLSLSSNRNYSVN